MKKKSLTSLPGWDGFKTLWRIMRLTVLISMCFVITAAANSYSQSTRLDLKLSNSTVKNILNQIETDSEYVFLYNLNELDENRRVDIDLENATIGEVLNQVLKGQNLTYSIYDRQVIIRSVNQTQQGKQSMQQQSVSGKVTSVNGDPIPGVTVVVKGTNNGTITNSDGQFTLNEITHGSILVFSFVGMVAEEITFEGQTFLDVKMAEETIGIEEVVAIGYGTTTIKDATGAVSSVNSKNFNKGMVSSPEQLIQGRTAGVQITSASGEPGAGISIRIRGTSSFRSGNNPLFVVDGVPLSGENISPEGIDVGFGGASARNPLNFLNPNDIESMSILKDASATAIYGSRGANGVVIITTKSGKGVQSKLDYSSSFGISTISKRYDVLDKNEFLDYAEVLGANRSAIDGGSETDWQDQIYRTGISQNHSVSYGSSDANGDYRVSLSYFDQQGIIKESSMTRYTARINGNRSVLNNKLKLGTQLTISDIDDRGVPVGDRPNHQGDLVGSAIYMNPSDPIRNNDETYYQPAVDRLNPVAMLDYSEDYTNTFRGLLSLSAEYKFTDNFSFKTNIGYDKSKSTRKYAYSRLMNASNIINVGRAGVATIEVDNSLMENFFTYQKKVSNISFDALLGYSYQSFNRRVATLDAAKFRIDETDLMINNISSAQTFAGNSSYQKDELQSFFGRVNLSALDKILFTATIRADGSTKFGDDNKYGYFPSLAFAYRLSEEDFIPEAFSNLKLRLGWGITGNQEIPHNLITQRQRYSDYTIDGSGNLRSSSLTDVAFANPNLKWESTSQFNAGLDYGFKGNKIRGAIDFYYKNTSDLLLQVTSAQPAPQPNYWTNLDANIINSGVDFSLSADLVSTNDFAWEATANMSYNKNIVKNFQGTIETGVVHGQGLQGTIQRIANNYPMYVYYMRIFEGFDENGIEYYRDGDFPQYTGASPLPKVTGGITNSFRYKNFDLNIYFEGQFGHKIYSNTANAFFYAGNLANGKNVTRNILNNGESELNTASSSTRFLEDGSFVRLQDVTLGYNLPVKSKTISNMRLYVTGQNLLLFTNYSGQDPEVNVNKAQSGVPSLGIDYTTYPRARTVTMGLNVTF
jgi:iron complex outermembrane receptor protein